MGEQQTVRFFVSGISRESQGKYLAKVLRTQEGIDNVSFDFKNRLIDISYLPSEINIEQIKHITYFKCRFISDEQEIKRQVKILNQQTRLSKMMVRGAIVWIILFLYALVSEILERPTNWIVYSLFLCLSAALVAGYYYQQRLMKQVNSEQKTT